MHALYGYRGGGGGGQTLLRRGHAARSGELLVEGHGKVRQRNADSTEQCKQAGRRECCRAALKSPHLPVTHTSARVCVHTHVCDLPLRNLNYSDRNVLLLFRRRRECNLKTCTVVCVFSPSSMSGRHTHTHTHSIYYTHTDALTSTRERTHAHPPYTQSHTARPHTRARERRTESSHLLLLRVADTSKLTIVSFMSRVHL